MKRVYLLPNLITAFGLACGLFVIFRTYTHTHLSIYQLLHTSALLLLLTALADVLDGAIARLLHYESEFGALFDSLADAISFGVAPAVLMLMALELDQGTLLTFCSIVAAMIYVICGVLRLVRYSVEANKKDKARDYRKNFYGIPIPAAAGCALSANLFLVSPLGSEWLAPSDLMRAWTLIGVMSTLGLLMISKVRFPSLKTLHVRVRSSYLVFLTALGALFILYGVLHYFALLLLVLSWLYLLTGCVLTVSRLIAGKQSRTLEDFEPESEDE